MNVEMNPYGINQLASSLLEDANELNQNIKTLYHILENIKACWEGQDATSFLNAMENTNMRELEQIKGTIQIYAEYLKGIPTVYETLDEIYATKRIG